MQSEISQSQKDKYCQLHLDEVSREVRLTGTEGRMVMVVARGWEAGDGVSGGEGENVLEIDGGDGCTTM